MVSAIGLFIRSTAWTTLLSRSSAPNADCTPGGNFDLSSWNLQLPTGSGDVFDVVPSKDLQGCQGYYGPYFYTNRSSSLMVLEAPGNPSVTECVTSPGSEHCRTEFREVNQKDGRHAAWHSRGTNVLEVTMAVKKADDGTFGTAISQVFAQSKPLTAIYYSRRGNITIDVKPGPLGERQISGLQIGQVPLGKQFTYRLSYSRDALSVAIDGKEAPLNLTQGPADECSFKLGNYNQGRSGDESVVEIASISLKHSSDAASWRHQPGLLGLFVSVSLALARCL